MRVPVVAAAIVAVVSAPAGAAELGRVADGSELAAGPVFAGKRAVWVERDARGALLLARSGSDNRVAVGFAPPEGLRYEVVDLAASSQRVAVVRRVLQPPPPSGGSCGQQCPKVPVEEPLRLADDVWAGPPDGPLRRLVRRDARAQCPATLAPDEVEVARDTVVIAETLARDPDCPRSKTLRVTGRITAHGPQGTVTSVARWRRGRTPSHLAAEGSWVAWQLANRRWQDDPEASRVEAFDLRRGRLAYRVPDPSPGTYANLDVDASGRLALIGPTSPILPCRTNVYRDTAAVAVATPSKPRPVQLDVRGTPPTVAISRGRLVLSEVEPRCFDPTGYTLRTASPAAGPGRPFQLPCRYHLGGGGRPAFDGRRLLYATTMDGCSPDAPLRVIATSSTP